MEKISLKGKDKAAVLKALYDRATPLGMGYLHYTPEPMTMEEAQKLVAETNHFDYVHGRVMKVYLDRDDLDPRLYDRDNGAGAAERALRDAGLLEGE